MNSRDHGAVQADVELAHPRSQHGHFNQEFGQGPLFEEDLLDQVVVGLDQGPVDEELAVVPEEVADRIGPEAGDDAVEPVYVLRLWTQFLEPSWFSLVGLLPSVAPDLEQHEMQEGLAIQADPQGQNPGVAEFPLGQDVAQYQIDKKHFYVCLVLLVSSQFHEFFKIFYSFTRKSYF